MMFLYKNFWTLTKTTYPKKFWGKYEPQLKPILGGDGQGWIDNEGQSLQSWKPLI